MEITKERIPLILSGEIEHEFFEKEMEETYYEFNDVIYKLKYSYWEDYEVTKTCSYGSWVYRLAGDQITKKEFDWLLENAELFNSSKKECKVYVHKWIKLFDKKQEIKKVEMK